MAVLMLVAAAAAAAAAALLFRSADEKGRTRRTVIKVAQVYSIDRMGWTRAATHMKTSKKGTGPRQCE